MKQVLLIGKKLAEFLIQLDREETLTSTWTDLVVQHKDLKLYLKTGYVKTII